ncbi:MAG: hypothetical protein ABSE00_09340 [Chitinispirillaceae bacterium]|jgi:hypothetical protein
MPKPAFLVDGHSERKVLQRICPDIPIKIINCNGDNVAIDAIAKRIDSEIRLLNNRNHPIVVIIDREDRQDSPINIEKKLRKALKEFGCKVTPVIGIADRMFENWILADYNAVKCHCKTIQPAKCTFEGLAGKGIIQKIYPRYHETTDGVDMFFKCCHSTVYSNSQSFRHLIDSIGKIDCNWLSMLREAIRSSKQ